MWIHKRGKNMIKQINWLIIKKINLYLITSTFSFMKNKCSMVSTGYGMQNQYKEKTWPPCSLVSYSGLNGETKLLLQHNPPEYLWGPPLYSGTTSCSIRVEAMCMCSQFCTVFHTHDVTIVWSISRSHAYMPVCFSAMPQKVVPTIDSYAWLGKPQSQVLIEASNKLQNLVSMKYPKNKDTGKVCMKACETWVTHSVWFLGSLLLQPWVCCS